FFFSSRRRHTRSYGDWSSDVCSSDLKPIGPLGIEIVTTSIPNGPIGFAQRVPFIAISPWSKGGYVNSQVFDHTSVVQFIEKHFRSEERRVGKECESRMGRVAWKKNM